MTIEEKTKLLDEWINGTYVIDSDGFVNVIGDVKVKDFSKYQTQIKFGNVSGHFNCLYNKLTTLEGCPKTVEGNFYCAFNELTTLEGCPQTVGGYFNCSYNELTTLEGSPKTVGGHFSCSDNKLTTLEGSPHTVGGYFSCSYNKIKTLQGCPQTVGGNFYCSHNNFKKDALEIWLEKEKLEIKDGSVILYKRVSYDFKTQEGTKNETIWSIGTALEHPAWKPDGEECGEGKYHACSRAKFCDGFRNKSGDRYIKLQVRIEDMYAWENPIYPSKIAFRKGIVLGECNKDGIQILTNYKNLV